MAYDGSIRINTKINGKGFNDGLKQMNAGLGRLAATLGITFGIAGIVAFGKQSVETAMKMEAGWQGLRYMVQAHGRDINQVKKFLQEYTEDGLVPMMDAQAAYKNLLSRGYETDQLEKMLLVMKDSAVYLRKGQLAIGESIVNTTMGLRTERSILSDSSGIEQNMYKMWQAYANEIGSTIADLTTAQKRIAEFNGFMKEGAIYAGAAAQYMGTYAGRVAQLTARMVDLRVSVGNAITPMLNALLPVITELVLWFTRLFNVIGRVMNLLFGSNVNASDMEEVAQATENTADAQGDLADNTEATAEAAKKALAAFDKINVLAQPTKTAGLETPEEVLPIPATETFPEELDELALKIEDFKAKLFALFQPAIDSFNNLMLALEPAKTFVATGLQDFYNNFLLPLATWVIGTALPDFLNSTAAAVALINWPVLNESLNGLWLSLQPFAVTVGQGLLDFYTSVLLPIGLWVSNDLAPAFLDLMSAAITALNELLVGASPAIKDFWDKVMMPIFNFAGSLVVGLIRDLTWVLERFGEWCKNNAEIVKYASSIILFFLAELWAYATVKKVTAWITGTLVPGLGKLAAALVGMNAPLILGAIGVAFLLAGIIAISKVWDKLTPQERTVTILKALAAALLAAAIAVAVFHTSWSVGLAAAAIVGGLALLASASYFSGIKLPSISTSGITGSLTGLPNFSLPGLATGAVVPANAPFAAILGDNKSQREFVTPENDLRSLVRDELRNAGMGQGQGVIHNVLQLDGQVLYESNRKIEKRIGMSFAKPMVGTA